MVFVPQEPEDWWDVSDACDVTAQVDIAATSPVSMGSVGFRLESAPAAGDLALWMPIFSVPLVTPGSYMLSSLAGCAVSVGPVARYLRWSAFSSEGSGTWSMTFKVHVARSRTPYFAPTQIPGCAAWFRADLGAVLSPTTTTVTSWTDQSSPTSVNLLSASGTTPTYVPAVTTQLTSAFAGYPTIAFAAANSDILKVTGAAITQPNTVILVVSAATSTSAQALFCGSSITNQGITIPASSTTQININAGTGVNVTLPNGNAGPSIIEVDWNGASTNVYQNGQLATSMPVNPGTHGLTFGTVGALPGSGGSDFLTGNVAELIVYNQALTAAQRTLVTRYLGGRYGITVP
jgi:hypothetical protein